MAKTSQLFNDFDTGAGSYNLFENFRKVPTMYIGKTPFKR